MRILTAFFVAATVFAGCLDSARDDADGETPGRSDVVLLPLAGNATDLPSFTLQLCDYGYRVAKGADADGSAPVLASDGRACDFRVTKPLLNASLFDWTSQHGPGNEVSMAVNPLDPLNLAGGAKDYTVSYISDTADCGEYTVWNGHFWSIDGGRTWNNDLVPGFVGDPRPSPLKGNLCNTDPVSVFDSDGTYWHNGLNYRGAREDVGDPTTPSGNGGLVTGSQIFFARSQDQGATFDRITFASYGQNDPGIFNDKNWVAVDPNSDHMIHTWTNFYAAGPLIMFVESFDAGATWTHPTPLTPGPSIPGVTGGEAGAVVPTGQFSMPQYDANGDIWVIWSAIGGVAITKADRVLPGEQGALQPSVFEPARIAVPLGGLQGDGCLGETAFRTSVYPVLGIATAGDHTGRLYLAWPQDGANGAGVFVSYSDDGIAWTEPVDVTAGLADDQFMSWIDVGPEGTVHVAYYDCSIDPSGHNMTLGYTYSEDGGDAWQGPFYVGEAAFDGDLGHHQTGAPFIGDYIAVDASDKAVHFFWADTRHGRSDVYAATFVKSADHMDLYAPELAG